MTYLIKNILQLNKISQDFKTFFIAKIKISNTNSQTLTTALDTRSYRPLCAFSQFLPALVSSRDSCNSSNDISGNINLSPKLLMNEQITAKFGSLRQQPSVVLAMLIC